MLGDGVVSIGSFAFSYCRNLTSITLGNSLTTGIGFRAFDSCSMLQYNEYDNGLYLGNDDNPYLWFIRAKNKSISTCEINNKTRFIHDEAFSGCNNLTNIVIPSSVTSIAYSAFSGCSNLTSIVIPESVTSMEVYVFSDCDNLTIYCEVASKPNNWHTYWNSSRPVYWYSEVKPTEEGNYWHSVDNEIVIW